MTFGEQAVNVNFNPSASSAVDEAKQLSARLLNIVEEKHKQFEDNNQRSWFISVFRTAAFNAVIAAQMAVVKFLTWSE